MSDELPVPTEEQILAALQRTGYIFEQKVADLLSPGVSTGWAFKDQDTGVSREVDIFKEEYETLYDDSTGKRLTIRWVILGECKNYQWPWVALTKKWSKAALDPMDFIENRWKELTVTLAAKLELSRENGPTLPFEKFPAEYHRLRYAPHPRAVQLVKLNKKSGGWETHSSDVYSELTYPLAKAVTHLRELATPAGVYKDDAQMERVITIAFPAIFVSTDIYVVVPNRGAYSVEKSQHVILERHLSSESTSGLFRYDVVTVDGIKSWYTDHVLKVVRGVAKAAGFAGRKVYVAGRGRSVLGVPRRPATPLPRRRRSDGLLY
ncbi:hypothetical protein ACLQ28_26135 [Micromonospora sp. DT201]|uniref:hypothetical protein n=1 Tax=Micromonospora sp. DT201 TaxID=3393442 RepID=UPI003CF6B355